MFAAAQTRAETTIYVGRHFEVRDHDAPVKYVFHGNTRVARVTGSLSANERLQRLRLRPGWNLVSLAVTAPGLLSQLTEFTSGPAPVIQALHRWQPATKDFAAVAPGAGLPAGTVLWISARTNAVVAVRGGYVEPSAWDVPGGGIFVATPALEAQPLPLPAGVTVWRYDGPNRRWQAGLTGDLASLSDLPSTLAPGEAIYVHSNEPTDLGAPAPEERIRYYHQDHLGSSSAMTDANGALVEETAFYPFGIPRHEHRLRQVEEPYTFTQKERDRESGLHYFEARYMAGSVSRFISPDPMCANPDSLSGENLGAFVSNPQKLNIYSYCANSPIARSDPSGLWDLDYGADGYPDMNRIAKAFGDPEVERLGDAYRAAAAFLPNAALDGIAAVIGINTANAPGFNEDGSVVKTYESLSYEDQAKNIIIAVGGGKLVNTGVKLLTKTLAAQSAQIAGARAGGGGGASGTSSVDPFGPTKPGGGVPQAVSKRATTLGKSSVDPVRAADAAADAAFKVEVRNYMEILRPIRRSMDHLEAAGVHPSRVQDLAFRQADAAYVSKYNMRPPWEGPLPGD